MLSFEPSVPSSSSILSRRAAFWILVGIGGVLAGVLLFDAYVDWVHQGDPLWSTVLENSIPALLGLALPYVGWRILRSTSDFPYLPEAARWALIGSLGMMLLSGLVIAVHVLQEEIKPLIIAFQLASVGAVAGLWVGYSLARVKEAEQRAKEDRGRLANLFDGLPAPVVHGRFEEDRLNILRVNAAFEEVFGQEVEEAEGRDLYNIVVPEEKREEAAEIDQQAIDEGLVHKEARRLTSQGPRDFQLRVAQALDDGASETYAIYTDITERKRRKQKLERQHDLFEKAEEIADVGAWEYDRLAEELTLTDQAYRVHGLSPGSNVAPEQVHALYHSEDRPAVEKAFRRALTEGVSYDVEARVVTEDGDKRWVRTLGEPQTEDGDVVRVRGAIQDITDQKQRERDLRLFKKVIEQANDAILITEAQPIDEPGPRIEYVNPAFEKMTGYTEAEITGKTPRIVQGPDTDQKVLDSLREALEDGESWSGETINYRKDGEPYHLRWSIAPVRDEDGEIEYWVSIQRDVTDEKERSQELREAKEEAEEASQLKSAMLANMSHELRTPLTSISGFAEVLEARLEGELEVFAQKIRKGSRRLKQTLESVLHLSKLEAGVHQLNTEEVVLGEVIEEVVETLSQQADEKSLTVVTNSPSSPVVGHWNEDALFRIGRNLLENAIKFTPEGGRIAVRVGTESEEAVLEIDDTGIGMEPENVPNLFKAFKQESEGLDREFEGSGLGLSIVKRLVENLGGTVEVDTEKDVGTRFTVRLPVTEGAPPKA